MQPAARKSLSSVHSQKEQHCAHKNKPGTHEIDTSGNNSADEQKKTHKKKLLAKKGLYHGGKKLKNERECRSTQGEKGIEEELRSAVSSFKPRRAASA